MTTNSSFLDLYKNIKTIGMNSNDSENNKERERQKEKEILLTNYQKMQIENNIKKDLKNFKYENFKKEFFIKSCMRKIKKKGL